MSMILRVGANRSFPSMTKMACLLGRFRAGITPHYTEGWKMARVQITPPHIAMMGIGCPTNQPVLDTLNPTQRLSIVNGYNRLKALPGGTVINRIELIDDQPHIQVDFHYEPRGQWGEHQSWSIPLGRREEEKAMHRLFRSNPSFTLPLSSVGAYKTIADVISDLNVMICEAPLTGDVARKLAGVVGSLQATQIEGGA